MPVSARDIRVYGSANMQETDSGAQGGAIDLAVGIVFNDINPAGNIQVVSSAAGDITQTVTATGRNNAGEIISEGKVLNGSTPVAMTVQTTWERLLKGVKSATTTGDVAVEAATAERSNTAQAGAASTITLDVGASAVDDFYNDMVIRLTGGTGAGQIRRIVDYVGSTKVATVDRDWGTNPDATTTFRIARGMYFEKSPNEITTVRRPFYNAASDPGAAKDYYEKVFFRNNHGTLSLTNAVISEQADPSGKITFGLAGTLNDTGTSTNRVTAPGSITFDSAAKNVANSQNHSAGAGQGTWLKLSLLASDSPQKTSYTLRETGNTV